MIPAINNRGEKATTVVLIAGSLYILSEAVPHPIISAIIIGKYNRAG